MWENFAAGSLALFSDPFTVAIFVFGVLGGMLFGAIPGVSMLTLAAILLPFPASLTPAQGHKKSLTILRSLKTDQRALLYVECHPLSRCHLQLFFWI